ncbi:MAG: thioesterase family protein [Thalassolituus sp.]|uniref:Thioesterase n=2 Tax=root TaxID=1 RepID=M5DT28_9GAMM|nr:thioesterase family protein [Thalassolituus oleivorans]PCI49195.1 MAG: thioesterase [Oceanospirillales bacterium]PHQ87866.1 MAG: thioesterase [Thalassobium sp.]AHK15588.1 thioesterase [Thalassolituus oleivorans R6-15]APR66794.1 thioesterase [Thalassolituus oleivorans]MBQ0728044.1 thioesterase family protein [Thalassolituus oleivorans]
MARVTLDLPDKFTFITRMAVRVSDINYGNHLGNDRMVSLLHEARLRYLRKYDFGEFNVGGVGIMVTDIAVSFLQQSFVGDDLTFQVGITDFNKYGCDFIYMVTNESQDRVIATAKTGIVFYDYDERKITPVPPVFYERCAPDQVLAMEE